jgi:shikimate dehydrogenase
MSDAKRPPTTGKTTLYAILGDPIAQVGSPVQFNRLFDELGHDGVMLPMRIAADDLETGFKGLRTLGNLAGLVFTIPHKIPMTGLVDELMPNGKLVGAINAARPTGDGRWQGDMFDGQGCVNALEANGHSLEGRLVVQAGAGGVGRAIAFAFAGRGIARLTVSDAVPERAEKLAHDLRAAFPDLEAAAGAARVGNHDTLVNCTPLGMKDGDPLPFPETDMANGMLAVDVVLHETLTPYLAAAQAKGCAIQTGQAMLGGQVREIARFLGVGTDD